MIKKWCQQNIIEEIQTMAISDLNTKTIRTINNSLYNAALVQCTSWRNALTMAGIDYEDVKRERDYAYSNGVRAWRRLRRLATAQDLKKYVYSEGLKKATIYKDNVGFFIESPYGNSALLLHEVKCTNCNQDILITHQMRAYYKKTYGNINVKGCSKCGHSCRGRGWTQEALLDAIEKLAPHRRTYRLMQKDNTSKFYTAGRKMFGSWTKAIQLCDQRWADRLNTNCDKIFNKETKLPDCAVVPYTPPVTTGLLKLSKTNTEDKMKVYKITKLHKEIVKLVKDMSVYKHRDNNWLCIGMKLLELTDAIGDMKKSKYWEKHFNVSSFTNYCSEILKDSRDTMTKYRINAKCIKDYRNDLYEKWEEDNSTQIPKYTVLYELLGKKKVLSDDKFKEILDFIINDNPSLFKVREVISVEPKSGMIGSGDKIKMKNDPTIRRDYTYITKHIQRHIPYNKLLKEIGSHLNQESKGAILTLPGSSPHADTLRLFKYYNNTSRLIWYENDKTLLYMLRKNKKEYETIMGKELEISLHTEDILKSSHSNVALANIDLQCTMSLSLMKDCINVVHHALKGRNTMGLIINTYGRGPKGMTLEQRDLLWNDFLEHTNCNIKYNSERQQYTCSESGPGGTMFLFGAVLSKRTQVAPTPKINKQIPF